MRTQDEETHDCAALRTQLDGCMDELDGLRAAMANRSVIEQAKGMLMLRLEFDEAAAFAYLREASNRANRKVAEIASDVVRTRAGQLPG
jgi:response regulator NasT